MLYQHCVGSFARELSFMQAAASVKMGSEQSFAAIRVNVCLLLNQLYHRNDVKSNGSGSSATDLKFW